jgi:hypothetical protein
VCRRCDRRDRGPDQGRQVPAEGHGAARASASAPRAARGRQGDARHPRHAAQAPAGNYPLLTHLTLASTTPHNLQSRLKIPIFGNFSLFRQDKGTSPYSHNNSHL